FAQRMASESRRPRRRFVFECFAAAAVLIVAVGAGWWGYLFWAGGPPARLLAQAYTQQRPFEVRIPGAEHAPVRVVRSGAGSPFGRPSALLVAEARISEALAKNPDGTEWLALRARAEMLASDAETAIATLTRALDQKPEDPDLQAALGMAYALRAEAA